MNREIIIPIIILNWHGLSDTVASVNSALAQTYQQIEIHLVDNNSGTEEQNELRRLFANNPKIILHFNNINLGFARAHNQIFELLLSSNKYQYIALLNNDAFAQPQWLEWLLKRAVADNAGMVSCKMLIHGNTGLINNLGHKMLNTGEILPIAFSESASAYNDVFSNVGASGGACLFSCAMLKDIGLFDHYFVTGYEDAELGVRALLAGYCLRYEPQSVVSHKISVSIDKVRTYEYTLKIQLDILYSYFKLMPWPVICCNAPFYFFRTFILLFSFALFGRFTYFRIFFHAWYLFLKQERKLAFAARREFAQKRKISSIKMIKTQEFFLIDNMKRFNNYFIKGQKTIFEKYKKK